MDPEARRALRPVVPTARHVLRDLDVDAIPQRLRRVAGSSARTLPPPLERSLFEVLATDDGFRTRVRDRWVEDGGTDDVVAAFLEDPESVDDMVAELSQGRASEQAAAVESELRARLAAAETALDEAKARLIDARASAADQLAESKAADKRAREGLERRLAAAETAAEVARSQLAHVEAALAERNEEIAGLMARIERLRTRASADPQVVVERAGAGNAPGAMAAELDEWERRMRPFRSGTPPASQDGEPRTVSLPPGIAPDTPEAVDALPSLGVHVLIDGYNVGGLIEYEGFTGRDGRDRVLVLARALSRTVERVTVVFDAAAVEGRTSYDGEGGVAVRFSAGESADDLIVDLAASTREPIAIVTNDRELRERASGAGAVVLWSDALIAWWDARS